MASKKQLAWRKKFAKMSKAGKFKKSKKSKIKTKKAVAYDPVKKEGGFPYSEYFVEYKKLGGKKRRIDFNKTVDIFTQHTWDIFIHGDASRYSSRQEALEAVKKEAKIDNKELNLIFESIDNVTAYT